MGLKFINYPNFTALQSETIIARYLHSNNLLGLKQIFEESNNR